MQTRQDGGAEGLPPDPVVDEDLNLGEIVDDDPPDDDPNPDDDPPPDTDDPGETDDDPPPADRRGGGGAATPRNLRARAQAAERALADREREIAELRGFQAGAQSRQQHPDPRAAAQAEQEWWTQYEVMSPIQQAQALEQRNRTLFGGALQQLRLEQQDLADQTRYEASCARSPTREAYREKVEDYRRQQLSRGFVIDREAAFHILLGKDTEARAARAAPGQRRAAAARVAAQQTRPTGARSTLPAGGRRPAPGSREADEAAIEDAVRRGVDPWNL